MEIKINLIGYLICLILLTYFSRKSLKNRNSHGFYRYFSWVGILVLLVIKNSETPSQIFSVPWQVSTAILIASLIIAVLGFKELIFHGNPSAHHPDNALLSFEKTTTLVVTGVFRTIRHPMYLALLLLGAGLFLQRPTSIGIIILFLVTLLLILTAKADERECVKYFGESYVKYMSNTKMFIPFLI